jgi:hypothetical protein
VAKLVFIVIVIGAIAESMSPKDPPLLIDSPQQAQPAPQSVPLDAAD